MRAEFGLPPLSATGDSFNEPDEDLLEEETGRQLWGVRRSAAVVDLIDLHEKRGSSSSSSVGDEVPQTAGWVDYSESHKRVFRSRKTSEQKAFCLGSKTEVYWYAGDRALVPEELAFSQGYGVEAVRSKILEACVDMSGEQVKDLFKDCMALPHVAKVLAAVLLPMEELFVEEAAGHPGEHDKAGSSSSSGGRSKG